MILLHCGRTVAGRKMPVVASTSVIVVAAVEKSRVEMCCGAGVEILLHYELCVIESVAKTVDYTICTVRFNDSASGVI